MIPRFLTIGFACMLGLDVMLRLAMEQVSVSAALDDTASDAPASATMLLVEWLVLGAANLAALVVAGRLLSHEQSTPWPAAAIALLAAAVALAAWP